jgi:hypothetical protein
MQVRRLFRDIQRGENDLDTMRRSRNWSRYRYHALVQLLKANDIPIPWSDYRFPDDFSKEERLPEVEPLSFTPLEQTKRDVMHDLERNCHQAPSHHRYSVNVFSNACDRLMREVIDLPSNRTLQDSFNAAVDAIDEA